MNGIEDPANARSQRTRAALLAASRAILEERGFDGLTMAAVAERAGVSRRGVYLHFASRSELVMHLFGYVAEIEGLESSTSPVWTAPDAIAALEAWARHISSYHLRVLPISQAIRRMGDSDPDAARYWERITRAQRANCRLLAERLDAEGRLATTWTVDTATDMLWALLADDFIERLLIARRYKPEQFVAHLTRLLRSTFIAVDDEA